MAVAVYCQVSLSAGAELIYIMHHLYSDHVYFALASSSLPFELLL